MSPDKGSNKRSDGLVHHASVEKYNFRKEILKCKRELKNRRMKSEGKEAAGGGEE